MPSCESTLVFDEFLTRPYHIPIVAYGQGVRLERRILATSFQILFDKTFKAHYLKLVNYFLYQLDSLGSDPDQAHELATEVIWQVMAAYRDHKIDKSGIYQAINRQKAWIIKDYYRHSYTKKGQDKFNTSVFSDVSEASNDELESGEPVDGINPFRRGWENSILLKIDKERKTEHLPKIILEAVDLIEAGYKLNELQKAFRIRKKTLLDSLRRHYYELSLLELL